MYNVWFTDRRTVMTQFKIKLPFRRYRYFLNRWYTINKKRYTIQI